MGNYQLLQGNCTTILKSLPAGSVQTCVTSPPYWNQRDYGTGRWEGGDPACDHSFFKGGHGEKSKTQLSSKGTQVYCYRDVCKKCGAVRVDEQIGQEGTPDEYIGNLVAVFREVWRVMADDGTLWLNLGDKYNGSGGAGGWSKDRDGVVIGTCVAGLKPKDLIGLPWMAAFALRADGWYLRRDIIWHKPNPMPESVTDRPTTSHEYVFLLSKSEHYYYNADEIAEESIQGDENIRDRSNDKINKTPGRSVSGGLKRNDYQTRNKRSVWTIATSTNSENHYASYPVELIEPCVLAGSRPGDTVLDPFNGTATTGAAALKHGRNYIGIDLNPDYIEISKRRLMAAKPIPDGKVTRGGLVQLGFGQIMKG